MINIVMIIFSFKNLHSGVMCQRNCKTAVGGHERRDRVISLPKLNSFLLKEWNFYSHKNLFNVCHVFSH